MAYTNPFKIANGLVLDFTLDAADADNDAFLGRNASGEVTSFSSIKATRISSGASLTENTSSVLTITGTGTLLGATTIQVKLAGAAQSGYLSTTDWNTFNNKLSSSLTDSYLFVGSAANAATGVAVSGDITMANDGTVAIAAGVIVNADVNANAAIALSKLAAVTASRALVADGSGFIVAHGSTTATQVGYLSNLSGDLQASLNSLGETIVGLTTNAIVQAPTASEDLYAIIWDQGNTEWTLGPVGAGGSVTGPGSSTDNAMVRWNGLDGTSLQNSAVILDDSNNMTGVTSITVGQSGIHIFDTGDDHDLILASGEDLTADHTLSFVLGDSDRTITLSGSPTMGDWFDQSVKAAASVVFADATLSNAGGLHLLDSDSSHDLIIRTTSNLTADRELIFVTGDATRTLTINASGTVYVTGGTDVALADGGTGASLSDPGADRIMFWDDSAGAVTWLTAGNGFTLSSTSLSLGGTLSGNVSFSGATESFGFSALQTFIVQCTNGDQFIIDQTNGFTITAVAGLALNLTSSSDARGDIYARNSSGKVDRIAKGAEGTLFRAGANDPAWSTLTMPNTITALSTFVANTTNTLVQLTPAAGQSIRVNAGGTAWEAFTPSSGSGDVTKVGTPVDSQIGVWTGDGTIEGDTNLQYDGTDLIIGASKGLKSGAVQILSDSAGTMTLSNIDVLDNTTQNTVAGSKLQATSTRYSNEIIATDATGTSGNIDLNLFSTEEDLIINVEARIIGIKSDGSQGYFGKKSATFRKDGAATAVQVGTTTTLVEHSDDAESTTIAMDSTNVRITYSTGDADSYRWTIFVKVTRTKIT